jgi:hypothetical protein
MKADFNATLRDRRGPPKPCRGTRCPGACAEPAAPPPLALELRERFLPERAFRGCQNKKLQYAVLAVPPSTAAPSQNCSARFAWWQTEDIRRYPPYGACLHLRHSRQGRPSRCTSGHATTSPNRLIAVNGL